jgi:predicted outer membrane protein
MKLRQKFSALAPALMVLTLAASTAYAQDKPAPATSDSAARASQAEKAAPAAPAKPAEKRVGAAAAPTAMTDGQILQIVRSLNDAEIKQANEAIDEGESEAVKTLAEMLKADHENSNKALDELLEGDRNLEDSAANDQLNESAEATHERLQDLAGNQYDCAYINAQVSQHEAALAMTKDQLIPNAKAADVGKFLTNKQASLEHHAQMAKDTLGKVQGCGAAQAAPARPATQPAPAPRTDR